MYLDENICNILWKHVEIFGMNPMNIEYSNYTYLKHCNKCFYYLKKTLNDLKCIKNDTIMNNIYQHLYIMI
jgi:hypothetical protein